MYARKYGLRGLPSWRRCCKHWQELIQAVFYSESKKTAEFVKPHKRKGVIERSRHFVDYVKVTVRGGSGGNGMMSFSSLPNLEWAGPDGGNGGNGGHVIFKVSHNSKSLAHINPAITAPKGVNGKTRQRDGKNSPHLTVQVPFGTIVKSEDGRVLASLDNADSMFIAARGGAGGKGNYFFLSNENRAPVMAEKGGLGQERQLHVELKTMAHAGLIGFPNAGKSSLLRAISRAQPKVSPYPFTTLNPHIGMVLYDDHQQLAVADIPGLIPGSSLNKGMGHSFLRHIERCLCLIYVIDLSMERPWEQLEQLKYELNQYKDGLADRPALLVANKMDLPEAPDRLHELKRWMRSSNDRTSMQKNECEKVNEIVDKNYTENRDNFVRNDGTHRQGLLANNHSSEEACGRGTDNSRLNFVENDKSTNIIGDGSEMRIDGSCNSYSNNSVQSRKEDGVKVEEANHGVSHYKNDDGILVLGVSAKRGVGISSFLHNVRVIYDSHLSSSSDEDSR